MGDMLPHVTGGKIWMEMSTTDEAEVKRLRAKVIEAGGLAADCPVSGDVTGRLLEISVFLQDVIAVHLKPFCLY